jgi:hypothetical protein
MNRRNFVVGLGTVATISGVASVSAASFASSVTPTANFQVVVDRDLTVERGSGYASADPQWSGSTIDPTAVSTSDLPLAYVDENTDANLTSQLAITNDETVDYTGTYDGFFQIVNAGSQDETISMGYTYGTDATDGANVQEADVAELFVFEAVNPNDSTTTQISPTSASPQQHGNTVTIPAGETWQFNLSINLTSTISDNISAQSGNPFEGRSEISLLSNVEVGTDAA